MLKDLFYAIRKETPAQEMVINGRKYTTAGITPVLAPTPKYLEVSTLTALVDYLKANVDFLDITSLICHIEDPTTVTINSNLHGDFAQRSQYIKAKANTRTMSFNSFLDGERFNIWLQSGFVESPVVDTDGELRATDKGLILKYVGNVKSEIVSGVSDDGITQEMTIKSGIASVSNVQLPNPVILRPYRTFNEVEQPASSFVFRAKDGPTFALIEADNGAWESAAMKSIKDFMELAVPGLNVIA